jgi:hypothetical protein
MRCPKCRSTAVKERPECTAQGYRRFRCLDCTKQFNERSGGLFNRTQYPSDVTALVVLWRLRYKLSLRDLAEMFMIRGIVFTYEAVRDWEAKLTPALAEELRRSRKGKIGRSWYVFETPALVKIDCKPGQPSVSAGTDSDSGLADCFEASLPCFIQRRPQFSDITKVRRPAATRNAPVPGACWPVYPPDLVRNGGFCLAAQCASRAWL